MKMALIPYHSEEFKYVVTYIQRLLHSKVYLIGLRGILENGIPAWRYSEDFDIHARITEEQRDGIIKSLREKFDVSNYRRTRFGFTVEFGPVGVLTVYSIPLAVFDESWNEKRILVNDVSVCLPPLEDILILKIMSPRKQDKKDVGTVLVKWGDRIDVDRLISKARKVKVLKKLIKLIRKYRYKKYSTIHG